MSIEITICSRNKFKTILVTLSGLGSEVLSILGFNAIVKDTLILKLLGSHKRVIKVKFEGLDINKPLKN